MVKQEDTATARSVIPSGTNVEVRTDFDRSWTNGFTVEEHTSTGYRLRRRSDGHVLPHIFPFDDVRHERRDLWWV